MLRLNFNSKPVTFGILVLSIVLMVTVASHSYEPVSNGDDRPHEGSTVDTGTNGDDRPHENKTVDTGTRLYTPPPDADAPSGGTISTGPSRGGCNTDSSTALTTLAPSPYHHLGQTLSTHPIFTWYVPDTTELPIEFQLYELKRGKDPQRILKHDLQSSPGFMKFSFPEGQPSLSIGQRYLWKVILFCKGRSRPSSAHVAIAKMRIVAPPPYLIDKLETLTNPVKRAKEYAKEGFWYDAIAEVIDPLTPEAKQVRHKLLQELEELQRTTAESIQEHSNQLKEIVDSEN